jgi:hypothetical protein
MRTECKEPNPFYPASEDKKANTEQTNGRRQKGKSRKQSSNHHRKYTQTWSNNVTFVILLFRSRRARSILKLNVNDWHDVTKISNSVIKLLVTSSTSHDQDEVLSCFICPICPFKGQHLR